SLPGVRSRGRVNDPQSYLDPELRESFPRRRLEVGDWRLRRLGKQLPCAIPQVQTAISDSLECPLRHIRRGANEVGEDGDRKSAHNSPRIASVTAESGMFGRCRIAGARASVCVLTPSPAPGAQRRSRRLSTRAQLRSSRQASRDADDATLKSRNVSGTGCRGKSGQGDPATTSMGRLETT